MTKKITAHSLSTKTHERHQVTFYTDAQNGDLPSTVIAALRQDGCAVPNRLDLAVAARSVNIGDNGLLIEAGTYCFQHQQITFNEDMIVVWTVT